MADARRRSTMQPAPDAHGNVRTGIPMPSTTNKPNQTARVSLAPAQRGPSSHSGPSTNPGQSVFRSQTMNPLLQSTSKSNYGRTPLHNSTRRGSMWSGGPQAALLPGIQPAKDPRPLRDRPYQNKMRQDILAFLQSTRYDISIHTLLNITGKDFRAIVYHLVEILDPKYPFDPDAKFEDEFVPALKALRYPFFSQIDSKWLAAPASMHSWPFLLGVLHWLVQMCKIKSAYMQSGHPTLQNAETVPEEFDDSEHHRALTFEFYDHSYGLWLDGDDAPTRPREVLENRYAKKNERVLAELETQKDLLNKAKAELKKLQSSAAPLEKLQRENGLLKTDNEKFQKILNQYEGRKKKLLDVIAYEKAELATKSLQLEQFKAEQQKLEEVVKTQNLSPEEVIRMNSDHESLARNLEDLKVKIAETHKTVMTLEVNVTNRAAAAEEAVDTYSNLLSSLGLLPPLAPPLEGIDLTLELNTAASNPAQLLIGSDIRKVIKPTLSSLAEFKRSERAAVESERIKVDDELDQLALECENVEEEIGEMEKKVASLNEQADDLRDAAQQDALISSAEATRLERELANARTAALAHGTGAKARLQALQFDYREQIEKIARLKEETVRAIVKSSNDIAMFKQVVSRHLQDLREFAEGD